MKSKLINPDDVGIFLFRILYRLESSLVVCKGLQTFINNIIY